MYINKEHMEEIIDALPVTLDVKNNEHLISKKELREIFSKIPKRSITIDQAMDVLENMKYKKEVGLDCTEILVEVLIKEQMGLIDSVILNRSSDWKIKAVRLYRSITHTGIVEAKNAVEKRAEALCSSQEKS